MKNNMVLISMNRDYEFLFLPKNYIIREKSDCCDFAYEPEKIY